jgi:acyl-CoA hydrolase
MQRAYISANYTHAAGYLLDHGVNVLAQLVAPGEAGLSLSCNTDITLDILHATRARGGRCLFVAETNANLPFMGGEAVLPADAFDAILDGPDFPLFGPPNMPVGDAEHAIGIRAAALVPDGGSVQIGIGSIGDAFGAALVMRHRAPELFAETLARLNADEASLRRAQPFEEGLYGISEMVVPAFLELYREGILKRPAADGALLHGGFFLGPRSFYEELRTMPEAERDRFAMRAISFVNALYGEEEAKRRDRRDARFVNTAMIATALGAAVSDALEDGRVVSGVGGQYNFVAQAFALDGARSIMTLPATRDADGTTESTIRWSYGHVTIPRHLRDVFVTEYGVADLRGRSDAECAAAMIDIADARFRDELTAAAADAGKLDRAHVSRAATNTPEAIARALEPARAEGWCGPFPFGTDFTEEEQRLMPALQRLAAMTRAPPT